MMLRAKFALFLVESSPVLFSCYFVVKKMRARFIGFYVAFNPL